MPTFKGAVSLIRKLRERYRVMLITARPPSSRSLTDEWLRENGFEFDVVVTAREADKSAHGADVLIDDYTGNIEDFVTRSAGLGILIDRPWNRRDRERLREEIDTGRVVVARNLADIRSLVDAFARRCTTHSSAG
jgi:5'(3')-deoxyribonucleotidase